MNTVKVLTQTHGPEHSASCHVCYKMIRHIQQITRDGHWTANFIKYKNNTTYNFNCYSQIV